MRSLLYLSVILIGSAPAAEITAKLSVRKVIGDSATFDRSKFITIHSSPTEHDWSGEEDKLRYLTHDLDVHFGRETGAITWELNQLPQDENHRGHVDFATMEKRGADARHQYASDPANKEFEPWTDLIIAAQVDPFWPGGRMIHPPSSPPWRLFNAEATAQYMVYWLNMYTGGNGAPRPKYLEVMNEPLYELLRPDSTVTPELVFQYHHDVARFIKTLNKDILLGGYTTAFPDLEKNDFAQFDERWKRFMDITRDSIDFHSLHLYDFPGIHNGKQQYRKGCQMEGTLDLLENYSQISSGKIKPLVISEYGSQLNDWYDQPWSPYRDWLCLKAINSMVMQFMQRPDRILKTIPFITAKAEWGYGYNNSKVPYYWRLLRKSNEPDDYSGDWVFTDQLKFYELWRDIGGERFHIDSTNPNLLVDGYTNGYKAWVIINNLVKAPEELTLSLDVEPTGIIAKHLYPIENAARFDYTPVDASQRTFRLGSESTLILELTLSEPVAAKKRLHQKKFYADSVVKVIGANQPVIFAIPAEMEDLYTATLRLGIGRPHDKSLKPQVILNGVLLETIPSPKGPSQNDRDTFFGILEIPVPTSAIKKQNIVEITFPDAGGHVSTAALQIMTNGS